MATNPRYANGAARRKVREYLLSTQDICGICKQPIDKSLPAGHPMAPEVDEIVPVSRGGSPYRKDNLQLTHRICNQKKSNKMPVVIVDGAFPTSRQW